MHERNEQSETQRHEQALPSPTNPATWTGEHFHVDLHEDAAEDQETHLSLRVSDGEETVVFVFRNSIRDYHTLFVAADQTADTHATSEAAQAQEQAAAPPAPVSTESPVPSRQAEQEKKPVKLVGSVTTVGALEKTKKQGRPILRFGMVDEKNQVDRHIVAFDSIATALASPETQLGEAEPITIFAWKHVNSVHIKGQEKQVEEWYVQKAIVSGKVFEKPRKHS